jgi:tetratricopeptide (TPR) repeat protein
VAPTPEAAAPEFAVPQVEAEGADAAESEPAAPEVAEAPASEPEITEEPTVQEVDLSEEWAALSDQLEDGPDAFGELASTLISQASEEPPAVAPPSDAATETQPAYELELEAPVAPEPEPTHAAPVAAPETGALTADDLLQSLANEFADAVPASQPETPTIPFPSEIAASAPSEPLSTPELPEEAREPVGPLGDVFDEFRADLDDLASNGEDLETHYNLGTAYREMGLLDEAISEFQKVAKAGRNGQAFRYMMQCCTLLGLAFMEKGQPGIAAMWYERALEIPGLDQESILALRYDLGVAQELAGDTPAARRSFSQVYGMNIDYRDVAERLAALGKGN